MRASRMLNFKLKKGDVVSIRSGRAEVRGSPLERPSELVLRDVVDGYLSVGDARRIYGVVIDPKAMKIDLDATKKLREEAKIGIQTISRLSVGKQALKLTNKVWNRALGNAVNIAGGASRMRVGALALKPGQRPPKSGFNVHDDSDEFAYMVSGRVTLATERGS